MWFMLNICFPTQGVDLQDMHDTECLCDQQPKRNQKHQVSSELLSRQRFTCVKTSCWVKPILCDSIGRPFLEVCTWFLLCFDPCDFAIPDFDLHPFIVMDHSHEKTLLSPVNFSRESSYLKVVLGILNITTTVYLF